jgi:chaperonin GroES
MAKKKAKSAKRPAQNKKPGSKKESVKKESKKGIVPLHDRVLVKPFDSTELNKTASGIIIPDTVSKEKPEQGEVIQIGDGRWENGARIPITVQVGDKVVFSKYGYDEIKIDGVEYYILKEDQILAVIKN